MGITKLRRGVHIIHETPVVKTLRRRLNDPDLITFRHTGTGQWVLAYWLSRDKGLVNEIDDLGEEFEKVTREFVDRLERCRREFTIREIKEKLKRQQRIRYQAWEDSVEEANDQRAYLRRKGWQAPFVG